MSENKKDLKELEALFYEHHKALCNLAYKFLKDKSLAEDLVQEVFIKLWNKKSEIRIESSIKGYLFKAVSNASLDELRKVKKIEFREQLEDHITQTDPILEENNDELLNKKIKESIDNLPPKCRVIFILSRFEGLKHKEIAERLDISVSTVETQISIALDKLRMDLKPIIKREFISISFFYPLITSFLSII